MTAGNRRYLASYQTDAEDNLRVSVDEAMDQRPPECSRNPQINPQHRIETHRRPIKKPLKPYDFRGLTSRADKI